MALTEVFDRLRTQNLKMHPDQCEFLRTEICYLRHTVTADGVKADKRKVQAVREFPVPKSVKELKAFSVIAFNCIS
jgi:hypothetical protein